LIRQGAMVDRQGCNGTF